jgi:hypothetical protein
LECWNPGRRVASRCAARRHQAHGDEAAPTASAVADRHVDVITPEVDHVIGGRVVDIESGQRVRKRLRRGTSQLAANDVRVLTVSVPPASRASSRPDAQTNAYGTLVLISLALGLGRPLDFDASFIYVAALFYLALFATVLAFGCHLTHLGRIDSDRAAYTHGPVPHRRPGALNGLWGYHWALPATLGLVMVLVGNAIVLALEPSACFVRRT